MTRLSLSPRARNTTVLVTACALLVTAGVWGALMMRADARHDRPVDASEYGPLTAAQYSAAVAVARHEIDRERAKITSVTAVLHRGTVHQPNQPGTCTSGREVRIRLVGRFPHIAVGGAAGAPGGSVTEVDITTDAVSGRACLLGVGTGKATPYHHAADLMPALDVS
jgi:hypothetical protein